MLAVVCLMRYEDWTYRDADERLGEHAELRAALGLARTPDHTTLHRFLRRLDDGALQRALSESVRRLPPPPHGRTTVAAHRWTRRAWLQVPSAPPL
jgi:hypothetical protein